MCFRLESYYGERQVLPLKRKSNRGRKKLTDGSKKVPLRLFVEERIVEGHGGKEAAQRLGESLLKTALVKE
jgi:hypothetical protein